MMPSSNNPTSVSATVGNRLRFQRGSGPRGIAKALIMPAILAAFATYLLYGIVVMKVPPSAAFPGPQFFPGIIAAGLSAFAIILGIQAVRAALVTPSIEEEEAGGARSASTGARSPGSRARSSRSRSCSASWAGSSPPPCCSRASPAGSASARCCSPSWSG